MHHTDRVSVPQPLLTPIDCGTMPMLPRISFRTC